MDTGTLILATLVKILIVLGVVVGLFAPGLVWAERRQSAMIQDRVGPHRAGITLPGELVQLLGMLRLPLLGASLACLALFFLALFQVVVVEGIALTTWSALGAAGFFVGYKVHDMLVRSRGTIELLGFLHPLADALKMIFKEDFIPPKADKFLHAMAPIITLIPALAVFAVIPFADTVYLDHLGAVLEPGMESGPAVPMQIAPLNVGILFIFAVASTGIIGAALGGYASDNKYSLMGGIRAASQMVSYEVTLGLTLVPAFMIYGSLRLEDMAQFQYVNRWGILYPTLLVSAVLFFTAAIAETKRVPFDLPEGESELVGGYLTEYSGMKFGMFFMSEFIEVVALSAISAVLFFGAWDVPFLHRGGWDLPGTWSFAIPGTGLAFSDTIPMQHWGVITVQAVVFFFVKVLGLIWFQLMIRWSLPRFRYDQVMALCWKGLLPISLANIVLTGVYVLVGGP